jgi:hypothetical protein
VAVLADDDVVGRGDDGNNSAVIEGDRSSLDSIKVGASDAAGVFARARAWVHGTRSVRENAAVRDIRLMTARRQCLTDAGTAT